MEPPGAERVALSQEASVGKGKDKGKDKDKQKGKGKDEDPKKENEEEAGNKKVKRVWDDTLVGSKTLVLESLNYQNPQ